VSGSEERRILRTKRPFHSDAEEDVKKHARYEAIQQPSPPDKEL
jgi:hypothetical protein